MRYAMRLPVASPYALADMARDTLGVLDALGLARAHVVGASMGGMIAQHLAVAHPQRVASLGLLMTTSGARHLPQPSWKLQMAMLRRPAAGGGTDAVVEHLVRLLDLIGSPAFPVDPAQRREQLRALVQRAWRPAGTARQLAAIVADGDRTALVGRIAVPTLVLHGEADPLVPVAAAHELAARIPGARLRTFPGMGHDLPAPLWAALATAIADHAQAAGTAVR
jgi:pimeloyl-ACP methyl ester carboxylesterase